MKKKKIGKIRFTKNLQLWMLCIIPLLQIFVFAYIPMGGLIIAFKDYNYSKGIFGSDWVGLGNFEVFLKSADFIRTTWNTLYMNFLFIIFGTVASLLVAIFLFSIRSRSATKVYQTTMIMPYFLSWVVVSYMAYAILHPSFGVLNGLIGKFGISPIDWYSKPDAWPAILTVCYIWKHVGMDSIIYYAALMGIDASLYEAADLDGANSIQKSIYVTLPTISGLIIIMTILKIGGIMRADFGLFYQISRDTGALYSRTDVIDTYIFRTMRVIGDMGLSSAVGFMQSVVGCILVVVTNTIVSKIDSEKSLF